MLSLIPGSPGDCYPIHGSQGHDLSCQGASVERRGVLDRVIQNDLNVEKDVLKGLSHCIGICKRPFKILAQNIELLWLL